MKKLLKYFGAPLFAGLLCMGTAKAVDFDTVNVTGALQLAGSQIIGTSSAYLGVANGGTGSNTAAGARDNLGFDFATASVTGTATIATTLGTVTICVAQVAALSADEALVQAVPSGGGVAVSVYGTDTTTLSSSPVDIYIFAGGTP